MWKKLLSLMVRLWSAERNKSGHNNKDCLAVALPRFYYWILRYCYKYQNSVLPLRWLLEGLSLIMSHQITVCCICSKPVKFYCQLQLDLISVKQKLGWNICKLLIFPLRSFTAYTMMLVNGYSVIYSISKWFHHNKGVALGFNSHWLDK